MAFKSILTLSTIIAVMILAQYLDFPSDMNALQAMESSHYDAQKAAVKKDRERKAALEACPGGVVSWENDSVMVCRQRTR